MIHVKIIEDKSHIYSVMLSFGLHFFLFVFLFFYFWFLFQFVPNFLVSSGTGLTPTLTPTTLANLESSFIELQSGGRDPVTQSGFVPPVVDTANSADHSQDSYDQSSSDAEWEPKSKMARYGEGIKGIDYIVTSTGTINATPQRKYTRRNKDEKVSVSLFHFAYGHFYHPQSPLHLFFLS